MLKSSLSRLFQRCKQWIKAERPLFLGVVWTLLLLAGVAFLFFKTETSVAKRFDIKWGFHWLIATAAVGIIGFFVNLKDLLHSYRKRTPSLAPVLAVLFLTLFSAIIATQWISLKHRVLSDESSWEGMAVQMYYNQSGGVCNQGFFKDGELECIEEVNNFKGKALALFELIAYAISSPGRDAALRVNLPLFLLSIPLLFLVVWHSTGRQWLAVTAAGALATLPTMLFQSRAASTEVLYIFLLLLIVHWMQKLSTLGFKGKQLLLLLPLMGIFAQTRQETIFAFAAFAWYWLPWFREKSWHAPVWTAGALLASLPIIANICGYKGYNFQGGDYAPHSLHNLAVNFWDNVIVMLGLERDPSGLLTHPFLTAQTVMILIGLVVVVTLALTTGKYRRQLWMGLLFFIQPIVIMVNVSGNFTIDINQRYVLTMFPAFAILAAIGWHELLERPVGRFFKKPAPLLSLSFLLIGISLVISHKADFKGNAMYHKNKLLEEEEYLHAMVRNEQRFPDSSIYIYARPWQFICSGRSAISETRFLHWSPEEFIRWQEKSGGNLFLVRGQDGYGTVNRQTRVVGFKTTESVEKILTKYETEEVDRTVNPFGYPLTTWRIVKPRGMREWTRQIGAEAVSQELSAGSPQLKLKWNNADSLSLTVFDLYNNQTLLQKKLDLTDTVISLSTARNGPQLYKLLFSTPSGDTTSLHRDFWISHGKEKLLHQLPRTLAKTEWGELRINRSVDNNTLRASGIPFSWGLGIHAPSQIDISLNGEWSTLRFIAALDDESLCGDGAVFEVRGDGVTLFKSKALYAMEWEKGEVNIQGVHHLSLLTLQRDNNMCDHTEWLHGWVE